MKSVDLDFYKKVDEKFYDDACNSKNPIRRWFHRKRHEIVNEWMKQQNVKNKVVVDMACGTCNWNINKFDVIGVDISKGMLGIALMEGRIKKALNEDITKTSLKNGFADIVILGDVLEHISNYNEAIKEAKRVLKRKGIIFCSVPYDTNFSLWKPLFNLYCLIRGYVLGSEHHKVFGGHINHFSPKKIKEELEKQGLRVIKQFNNMRFTIYTIATKG